MDKRNSDFPFRLPPTLMEADQSRANLRQHGPDDAEVLQLLSKGGSEPPCDGDELPPGITVEQAIHGR
jgi:hypothetical protein